MGGLFGTLLSRHISEHSRGGPYDDLAESLVHQLNSPNNCSSDDSLSLSSLDYGSTQAETLGRAFQPRSSAWMEQAGARMGTYMCRSRESTGNNPATYLSICIMDIGLLTFLT